MGDILQFFGVIFLLVSCFSMIALIFFSLTRELKSKDRWIVISVTIGGIFVAFTFLLIAKMLLEDNFNKIQLLKEVCRIYGMITILISLFSTISIMVIAKDTGPNSNVMGLLAPASLLYVFVGYFFIGYGESLHKPFVLFWYLANGITFVMTAFTGLIMLLVDALHEAVDFNKQYLVISIILAILLGIVLLVSYNSYSL